MTDDRSPYAPPRAELASPDARDAYFTVGALKFSLLSLTTLGIYPLYWFYQNWKIVRERENASLSPFWRTFFTPIWIFSLGSHFRACAAAEDFSLALPVTLLGISYIVLNAVLRLPDPYWLISLLSFVPIIPFDTAARRINGSGSLAPPTHGTFSGWNIVCMIVGTLVLLLALVGVFFAPEA